MAFPASLPSWFTAFLPGMVWRVPGHTKELYLTFDDGPIPEVTPKILDLLEEFQAKATFFCIGHNIHKHPDLFREVQARGHAVGNHTYHHVNGWKNSTSAYLQEVEQCQAMTGTSLFRPPYGKIKPSQYKALKEAGYQIIMWEVLSADYEPSLSADQVWQRVINHTKPGSILLFHDSLKAEKRVLPVLKRLLAHYSSTGYSFRALSQEATV